MQPIALTDATEAPSDKQQRPLQRQPMAARGRGATMTRQKPAVPPADNYSVCKRQSAALAIVTTCSPPSALPLPLSHRPLCTRGPFPIAGLSTRKPTHPPSHPRTSLPLPLSSTPPPLSTSPPPPWPRPLRAPKRPTPIPPATSRSARRCCLPSRAACSPLY